MNLRIGYWHTAPWAPTRCDESDRVFPALVVPANVLLCRAATATSGNDPLKPASARTACHVFFLKTENIL